MPSGTRLSRGSTGTARPRRPCRYPATGEDVPPGACGELVLRLPLPPGCLPTLWGDDQRFTGSCLSQYPGSYITYITGDGGFRGRTATLVTGRTGDVTNVAGRLLSAGEMEEIPASHAAVAECAVTGVHDPLKGEVPRGFVVLKAGIDADPGQVSAGLAGLVRAQIGAIAALRRADVAAALPKTRPARYCARPCAASPAATPVSPRPPPSMTSPPPTPCVRSRGRPTGAQGQRPRPAVARPPGCADLAGIRLTVMRVERAAPVHRLRRRGGRMHSRHRAAREAVRHEMDHRRRCRAPHNQTGAA